MCKLKEECRKVLISYPSLKLKDSDEAYLLRGKLTLNAEFNDLPLYDVYSIEIEVPKNFPKQIPVLRFLNNKELPLGFDHFNGKNEACLGTISELCDFIDTDNSILDFINEIIMSYLYSLSYYKRYEDFPYGERSHGFQGIWETYYERYHVHDKKVLVNLLLYTAGVYKYRGHHECPCRSGNKIRNCHGQLILKDLRSDYYPYYRYESSLLLEDYMKERRSK